MVFKPLEVNDSGTVLVGYPSQEGAPIYIDQIWQLEPEIPASAWTVVAHSQAGHVDHLS